MALDLEVPHENQEFEPKLLEGIEEPESHTLSNYESLDGYATAEKLLTGDTKPEEIEEMIDDSGLRGRGGAGFPTGMKWSFVPDNDQQKYLIANADESEPGCFKDRVILEQNPHLLIEGMIISAYALDTTVGFIYIRGEYRTGFERLEQAMEEAQEAGYLGDDVFGSGFDFKLHLNRGAGAYIVGEETALMNSIEGKRGIPRSKPPFPAIEGLFGKPTVINNVETLSNVPLITENGPDWYRNWGSEKSPGFRLFSISGHVEEPGVYEIPLEITFREAIENYAGGFQDGREPKGIFPGGSSTPPMKADQLDTEMTYEGPEEVGTRLGAGGVIVMDETTCMPKMARRPAHFYGHESCGHCTPCREGVPWLEDVLEEIEVGRAGQQDLERVNSISNNIDGNCFCPLGPSAANPVMTMMEFWGEEFEYHLEHGECAQG